MTGWVALATLCGALAATLLVGPPPRPLPDALASARPTPSSPVEVDPGVLRRFRLLLAALTGGAGLSFVDGVAGVVLAGGSAAAVWLTCTRAEPPAVRRERQAVARGLPHVARLLGVALAAGHAVSGAFGVVADALPGPASAPLARARAALAVGVPAERVFADLTETPGLEPLGRALARSAESGASVVDVVARLTAQLTAEQAAAIEDRARTVGIRAAVPLGLCLLPAFLLLGIVPVVAGALGALRW